MSENNSSGGIGLFGALGIVFVVLKLLGVISWSWWLVLLPFYGGLVLLAIFALVTFTVLSIMDKL